MNDDFTKKPDEENNHDFILVGSPKDSTEDEDERVLCDNVEISPQDERTQPLIDTPEQKDKKNKRKHSFGFKGTHRPLAFLMIGCMLISALFGFGGGILANHIIGGRTVLYQSANGGSDSSNGNLSATESVAQNASDSIVEIVTESVTTSQFMQNMVTQGAGSGVILSADGYIATNNHVIEGASKITVTTKDEKSYEAKLIGTDAETDVAVIKIDTTGLQPVVMGNSDQLVVGQQAVAIGNPLGKLGGTVTDGIISALNREITIDNETLNLLQTDTAINPGNSGGGLFNSDGELIGLVVAKSSGEDVEGLGFAIPVNDVKTVVEALISDGHVSGRAALGVSLVDVNSSELAMQYRVNDTGVYINQVTQNSAAASAGLSVGDRIVAIDGSEVSSTSDVKKAVRAHAVGDQIEIKINRDGKDQTVKATLGEDQSTSN